MSIYLSYVKVRAVFMKATVCLVHSLPVNTLRCSYIISDFAFFVFERTICAVI